MIALLSDNDWTHIENILGGIGFFIFFMFIFFIFFIGD